MRVNMKLPKKSAIHIVDHYCGKYWGSCSFLIDLVASLTTPERIIIFSHKDVDASYFTEEIKNRFSEMKMRPEDIGRILCVDGDNIEEQLFHQEMGLYPGMEMVALADGSGLSSILKYIYNGDLDLMKWISAVVSIQCGFNKSFIDILKTEYSVGTYLNNGYLNTYLHESNCKPTTLEGEIVKFDSGTVGNAICNIEPIISVHSPDTTKMVDTLSS